MIVEKNVRILFRIYLGVLVSYFIVKFIIRPFVLDNDYNGLPKVFVLSYPNFCEAVVGSIFITFVLLGIRGLLIKRKAKIIPKLNHLYFTAVLIAGIYVILQEFKIHNLGGNNVYDSNDVIFSLLGLVTACYLLFRIKPEALQINRNNV